LEEGSVTRRTAFLILDVLPILVPAFAGDDALLERLATASAAARAAEVDVAHVRVAFRDGYPDVAATNKIFSETVSQLDFTEENPATQIHPKLKREPHDLLVTKRRVSAFSGSDLEVLLRSRRIERLVLAGVTTSGVVLSTLRAAADLDYEITVLADGCADPDPEVHELLLEKVFPAHAEVVQTSAWLRSIQT
jgi:nicotinamidase-related amidase